MVRYPTGVAIKPTKHAKYLGIWLDKALSFDLYRERPMAKANGWRSNPWPPRPWTLNCSCSP